MKIKVTIIDDHTLFREGLQRLLVRHDIDVISSVSNGEEGIKSIEKIEPDIILLDLRMPDISGIEVLKKLRETGARVEISRGPINEMQISKDIDLSNFHVN